MCRFAKHLGTPVFYFTFSFDKFPTCRSNCKEWSTLVEYKVGTIVIKEWLRYTFTVLFQVKQVSTDKLGCIFYCPLKLQDFNS